MSFLFPSYLWALLGLIVPIAIHLWSKKEGKTVKIGSIKLLSEADSKQSRSIKLNEYWLLILRMLAIALLTLILAQPTITKEITNKPITYLVEPSLVKNEELKSVIDSLADSDIEVRYLAEGFPKYDNRKTPKEHQSKTPLYWQLASDMNQLHSDSIVIFSKGLVSGIKGMRPSIDQKTDWLVFDSGNDIKEFLQAKEKDDHVSAEFVTSNPHSLVFDSKIIQDNIEYTESKDSIVIDLDNDKLTIPLIAISEINILLINDDEFISEARFIEAAINALSKHLGQKINITKSEGEYVNDHSRFSLVIWLSSETYSDSPADDLLIYKEDVFEESLIVETSKKGIYHLTSRLNSENVINQFLAESLLPLIVNNEKIETMAMSFDQRVVSKQELTPIFSGKSQEVAKYDSISLSNILWLLLLPTLIVERFLSYVRKQ